MANDYIIKIEGSWPSGETEYVIGTEDPQRLPMVSSDDNGDVLTVVDGKWSDAAPGGGGGGGSGLLILNNDTLSPVEGKLYVYLEGVGWTDITQGGNAPVYIYDGTEADLSSGIPCSEQEEYGAITRTPATIWFIGKTDSQPAPHKQGETDNAVFVTSASTVITLPDSDGIGILPSTAVIETGYME